MLYMIKLRKGELWRPQDLQNLEPMAIRVRNGVGWITFKCSEADVISRAGESVELSQEGPLIEALSDELDIELIF